MTYCYPRDLVTPLRSGWNGWFPREGDVPELPNDDALAELLEIAYHASFTLDEQRRTRLAITVCDPHDAHTPLCFNETRPLSVHELMRLGPVAARQSVVIGVTRPTPNAPARIWGLCSWAFMQLTISIVGPGSVEVGRNNIVHVALRGGRVGRDSRGRAFGVLSEFLQSANALIWTGVTFPGGSWSPERVVYPRYAMDIARTIARAGHGGAVLFVPDTDAENFLAHPDWVRIKYSCNDNALWEKLTEVIRGYDGAGDTAATGRAQLAEAEANVLLARVAKLAAVDGAVVLTDRLRLLGFGAEVTVRDDVTQIAPDDGTPRSIEDFGTRHRSAFRFCSFYPAGLALVCSQDGGIKAIRKVDGTVRLFEE